MSVSESLLLIAVNDLGYFISHRLPVAMAARKSGYTVHVAYGTLGNSREGDLVLQDFILHHVPIQRGGINPLTELWSVFSLWRLFRRVRPDLVHLVTIKLVLYGGIAARLARVQAVVSAMAGLGFLFIKQNGLAASLLRCVSKPLFRWALGHPHQMLIFQNRDDRDQVLTMTRFFSSQTRLIRGSGIDLAACPVLPEPDGPPIVVMASRLLRDKGVQEFVAAARIIRERGVSARFWLIGEPDFANPASLSQQEIEVWKAEGILECLGRRSNIPTLYAQAHIVTLPSYREGLPKSLIEAAACGRTVVTTDVPGCRDAIEPGVTGLLVPVCDAAALADALERLIGDTGLRQAMGIAGRSLAEREFSIEKVVAAHLQIYRELLQPCVS